MHSDYIYKDRKMMKWIPFNALLEQGSYINDLLRGREQKQMPSLSTDQQEELNYKLETAYVFKNELTLTYFEKDDFKHITGHITRTDMHNKIIFINDHPIYAQTITDIEIL